jgi:hypothetical protein
MSRIRRDLGVKSSWRYDIKLNTKRNTNKWHCDKCNKDILETSKEGHLKSKTHLGISIETKKDKSSKNKIENTIAGDDSTLLTQTNKFDNNNEITDEYLDNLILPK